MYIKIKQRALLIIAILLISFGTFNLSLSSFAQQTTIEQPTEWDSIGAIIVQRLISEIGPIVAGIVTLGIQFARKQGLKISAEAEEYFTKTAESFIVNQSRFLYKEMRNNPKYAEHLAQGRVPPELGKKALENVKTQLVVELRSDEFTKATRELLRDNLEPLVERMVTQSNKKLAEKVSTMFSDLVPVAVDAVLLHYDDQNEALNNKDKIVDETLKSIEKIFDYENLLFSNDDAIMRIKAELNKRIGSVK